MRGLTGKVAVVTGAAGGIGRSLCRRFCEEGAHVVAIDLDEAGLAALGTMLASSGGRLSTHPLDITDHVAVVAAIGTIHAREGRIDILVNNAGWDVAMPFLDTDPSFWNKVIAINLTGPLNLHHAVLPFMIADGGGKVVNIASDAGRVGSSGESVYSACKGGITSFSKTVAREYARRTSGSTSFVPDRPTRRCCNPSSAKASTAGRSTTASFAPSR